MMDMRIQQKNLPFGPHEISDIIEKPNMDAVQQMVVSQHSLRRWQHLQAI